MTISGFVAGTLVHTDKGLVPIEQLKVGDMVLSKHESDDGEQAYKRVIKTFKSAEKKPVVKVTIDGEKGEMHLFCTPNHPFWTFYDVDIDWSWQAAINLKYCEFSVLLKNGHKAMIDFDTSYLIQTSEPDIAFVDNYWRGERRHDDAEIYIDFRQQKPVLIHRNIVDSYNIYRDRNWENHEEKVQVYALQKTPEAQFLYNLRLANLGYYDVDFIHPNEKYIEFVDKAYRATVYNIEVEVCHTYYVGRAGIFTHS